MTDTNEVKKGLWISVRGTVVVAICLFITDAFLLGTVSIGMFAVPVIVLWMIPKTLFALKRKDILVIRALKTGIYAVMAMAIFAAYAGNDHIARMGAEKVVAAVNEFKADRQNYPGSLKELVPKYLERVPRAKYVLLSGAFHYMRNEDGQATLMYYGFPPFERRIYYFAHQKWKTID